jgi:phosphate transport system permease protein
MATDTSTRGGVIESFGEVNKTVGRLFKLLLQAATLFGLVILAILLVFVTNDAIQPLTADPGWHLTFLLVLVVPTLAVGGYLYYREPPALRFGATVVGLAVVSLMFGGGLAMVLVDIVPPPVWFAYTLALSVPIALSVAVQRYAHRLSFLAQFGAVVAAFYLSLFGFPGVIAAPLGVPQVVPSLANAFLALPLYPVDWMLVTASVGLVAALAAANYFRGLRDVRTGVAAGAATLGLVAASAFVGPAVGVTPVPATVLASVTVVPTLAYVVGGSLRSPELRPGVLLPAIVALGALGGAFLVESFGFAGPQSWVDWQFLTSSHSRTAIEAGLYPAIGGSILLMVTVAVLSFPLGVGAAVYLEEYAPDNRFTRFIDVNISNLAGVPSVVYGLLGLGVFVTYLGQPTGTVAIGGATLALLILPIVIISSREAIRSVPNEMRQASYGMGATKWQTVRRVVLPRAFPGILTGTILSLGRAIGETAPLIMIGAPSVVFSLPSELSAKVSAMPLQVFAWASLFASEDFYTKAVPAGVVVLVSVLLAMNSVAIVLRNRYQSEG